MVRSDSIETPREAIHACASRHGGWNGPAAPPQRRRCGREHRRVARRGTMLARCDQPRLRHGRAAAQLTLRWRGDKRRTFVFYRRCHPCPERCTPRAPTTACRDSSTRPPGSSGPRAFTGRRSATSSAPVRHAAGLALLPLRHQGRTCSPPSTPRACGGSRSACSAAIDGKPDAWERLEAACVAHLEALLEENDYAQVVIRVRPTDVPSAAARLVAAARRLRATVRRARRRAAARARRRPAQPAADAARRAQLVADLVPAGPRQPAVDRPALRCAAARAAHAGSERWTSARRCSSPRSASTATTAAAGSSPRICATPAWR